MAEQQIQYSADKATAYRELVAEIGSVVAGETSRTARYATTVSLLKAAFGERFFWCGFYEVDPGKSRELVVGPYQGTLGCLRIPFGKGVCGACAASGETVIVPDPADRVGCTVRLFILKAESDPIWGWIIVRVALIAAPLGETMRADLATALSFKPTHLSVYHLTLEPNTVFAKFPPQLPDDDAAADMQALVEQTLADAGQAAPAGTEVTLAAVDEALLDEIFAPLAADQEWTPLTIRNRA